MPTRRRKVPSKNNIPPAPKEPKLASENLNENTEEQSQEEQLKKELLWCIEQLNLSLSSSQTTKKQASENMKAFKTLASTNASLVKKRILMRQMFGDYRNKIENEENKWLKDTKMQESNCKIVPANSPKSTFIKSSKTNSSNSKKTEKEVENLISLFNGENFSFNFDISEE